MKRALHILACTGGALVVLVAAVSVAALVFPWNWLRGPLDRRIGDAVGRSIAVDGMLAVHLGRTTRVVAEGVRIANPPWGSQPNMLQIRRLTVGIDLPNLLWGRLVIPELLLDGADIDLEKNTEGEANWHFANPKAKAVSAAAIPSKRSTVPIIERLALVQSRLAYKDPTRGVAFNSQVATAVGGDPEQRRLRLEGQGTFQQEPFHLVVEGGSILTLRNASVPYPVRVEAQIGQTSGGIDGTVTEPLDLAGLDLQMHVAGADLAELYPIFGIPLPHTAPYSFRGQLAHQGEVWAFHDFTGKVGDSDLAGNVTLTEGGPRPKLSATLASQTLDIRDLSGLIGSKPGQSATRPDRVLPDQPINLDKLRAKDMNVHFVGERLLAPKLPVDQLRAVLVLDNGRATLDPVAFHMARGDVAGRVVLNGRAAVPTAAFQLNLSEIKLRDFFEGTPFTDKIAGVLGARVDLTASGDSTAALLARSDGRLSLFMGGGNFSDLAVQLVGLDISKALGLVATKDEPVGVRCLVADFPAHQGVGKAETLVLDTEPSAIIGQGDINFANESIDLRLAAHPKQPSLFKVRSDVYIRGTFKHPEVGLNPAAVATQGGAATALGILLTPLGALLPYIDLGLGKNSPCQQLIRQSKAGGPATPVPPD